MDRVFRFEAQLVEPVVSHETFPIVDDSRKLMGSFVRLIGDQIRGWVAGSESPVALNISTGDRFWFTPFMDAEGFVSYAVVSENRINVSSVQITMAEEEMLPIAAEVSLEQKT